MKNKFTLQLILLIGISASLNAQQWGRYTLVATQSTTARLVDTASVTYKTWSLTGTTGYSSYMLEGGILLRTVTTSNSVFSGGGMHGRVQKVNWAGNIIWDYTYSTTNYCAHHDICAMPNGNVLLIVYELKTAAEVLAAGCSTNKTMWPDKIIEVKPTGATTGQIVWEWHAWDHLVQNVDATKANYYSSISDHPELLNINYKNTSTNKDWIHMNGIDYNAALDQITFSSHNLNEAYVIDHSTTTAQAASHSGGNSGKGGDILYRWGNPAAYGMAGTAILNVTHDAHWIPEGCPRAGSLVSFNNGGEVIGSTTKSTVDFYYPPYSGYNYTKTAGVAYSPATYDKRIVCNGRSTNMSNSQQLPNGNTLYSLALSGKIYEVDSNGAELWNFSTGGSTPQASRYSNCFINGPAALDATTDKTDVCAGTAIQLNASAIGNSTITYNWSAIGDAFTSSSQNPLVTPIKTTTYVVEALSNSCSKYDTVTVIIKPKPVSNIVGDINVLTGTTHTYQITPTTGSSYNWMVNGGNILSGAATNQIIVEWSNAPSIGFVKLLETNQQGCVSDTNKLTITMGSNTLNVTPAVIGSGAQASSFELVVSSSQAWDVTTGQSWVTLNKANGNNGDTVIVSLSANPTGIERLATIFFTSGSLSYTVAVNQQPLIMPDLLLVDVDSIKVNSNTNTGTINITCNRSFTVSSNQSWAKTNFTNGGGNTALPITIDSNNSVARVAEITITAGLLVKKVYISQQALNSGLKQLLANQLVVYPNPASTVLQISGDAINAAKRIEMILFDTQGKQVLHGNRTQLDVHEINNGIYFLQVNVDGQSAIKKISIIK